MDSALIAHYVVRPRGHLWLLERKDTHTELALFDTYKKAKERAESLAHDNQPSLLELYHGASVVQRRYPLVPFALGEPFAESYE